MASSSLEGSHPFYVGQVLVERQQVRSLASDGACGAPHAKV